MSQNAPLYWHVGEDVEVTFDRSPADDTDLIGATLEFWFATTQANIGVNPPVLLGTAGITPTIVDGDTFRLVLPHNWTATITPRTSYWYQVRRTDAGNEAVLAEGTVTVRP